MVPLPWQLSRQTWSLVLGYGSIAAWICAQVPQILENIRLQSCEGLALPFLLNWFFGDFCNLVGCLLTNQRPFQIWCAAYFCLMDVFLTGQYFYYTHKAKLSRSASRSRSRSITRRHGPRDPTTSAHSHYRHRKTASTGDFTTPASPELHLSVHSTFGATPATAGIPSRSRSRPGNGGTRSASYNDFDAGPPSPSKIASGSAITVRPTPYRDGSMAALQEAALDVARAAAKVERSRSRRTGSSSSYTEKGGRSLKSSWSAGHFNKQGKRDDEEEGEDKMMESWYSDMSSSSARSQGSAKAGGNGRGGKRASRKGKERLGSSSSALDGMPSPALSAGGLDTSRGRTTQRALESDEEETRVGLTSPQLRYLPGQPLYGEQIAEEDEEDAGDEARERRRRKSKSRSRSKMRGTSERAAGVVFMSVFALFGWGGIRSGIQPVGKGLVDWHGHVVGQSSEAVWGAGKRDTFLLPIGMEGPQQAEGGVYTEVFQEATLKKKDPPKHYPEAPDMQRIIGRISAWICTTLYLTSRLPQIWKNYNRKSVEGLSILLFVFAFLGNTTYVASILINPTGDADPSEAGHYLLEALPYLLGSGGTLIFDMTIMFQSVLYGSNVPIDEEQGEQPHRQASRHSQHRSGKFREDDEREPLIRSMSRDSAVLTALHNAGHRDQSGGVGALESGETTPTQGRG